MKATRAGELTVDTSQKLLGRLINDETVVLLDLVVGLRGWGLILYGVLPANLALLGFVEIKLSASSLILLLLPIVVFLPLVTTFLLIRNRHKDWYLTTKLLNTRSFIVTLVILLLASLISGLSGIIHGRYLVSLAYFGTMSHLATIAESFLMAVGSLVLSSTLFLTILTKDSDFPGLPSTDFVRLAKTIRESLRGLQASQVWLRFSNPDAKTVTDAKALAENLKQLSNYSGLALEKLSFKPVDAGVKSFIDAVTRINNGANADSKRLSWDKYFGASVILLETEKVEKPPQQRVVQDDASRIRFLKELPLGK